jgi:hypothetical protein
MNWIYGLDIQDVWSNFIAGSKGNDLVVDT